MGANYLAPSFFVVIEGGKTVSDTREVVVGATLDYHLASAGSAVTIIDRSQPASGVTARSFAWINVVHGNAPDLARLRNLAIADYRRLEQELNGALAVDWNGALTWSENPTESERVVAEHTAWGYDVRLVERDEIRRLEPQLVALPPVAAYAPGEGALDPVAATLTLVGAAMEAGAKLIKGSEVKALANTDGRVSGVVLPSGAIEADIVVIAAGTDSTALCADIGIELPVESSPATLCRFAGPKGLIGRVVSGPDLEIRQDTAGRRLFVTTMSKAKRRTIGLRTRSPWSVVGSAVPTQSCQSMPGSVGGPCPPTACQLPGSHRMRPVFIWPSCMRAW